MLLTNSTLSAKFTPNDFYEYEPKQKSATFRGFPYFVIKTPSSDMSFVSMNHAVTDRMFDVEIIMRVEYLARDNVLGYINAIAYQIDASESTFEASGYYNPRINVRNVIEVTEDSKELVEATFTFSCNGFVNR